MATLGELAKLVRSKNAGPFWLTIDIMFDDAEAYRRARDAEIVNRAAIARLYNRNPADVIEEGPRFPDEFAGRFVELVRHDTGIPHVEYVHRAARRRRDESR